MPTIWRRTTKNDTTDVFVRDLRSGSLRRINVGANGREANARSFGNKISADGRYAVFASEADNLVPNDTNGAQDIFVRDLENAITRRVSVRTGGRQANGPSFGGSITPDGRSRTRFAFRSASNRSRRMFA